MNQIDLVKALGGAKCLADTLRSRGVIVADVTVRSWTLSGRQIPAKYWSHIVTIAREAGHEVSFEALAQSVAARTQQVAA
jgi:hypothetical protein